MSQLWSSFEQGTPPWINVYEIILGRVRTWIFEQGWEIVTVQVLPGSLTAYLAWMNDGF
jgi:hypothetical protein